MERDIARQPSLFTSAVTTFIQLEKIIRILCRSLIIVIISFLLSCSKQDKASPPQVTELTFEVDSTKLELASVDQNLGIQFNAPKGWTPITQSLFVKFSKQDSTIFLKGTHFMINPSSIFLNKDDKSLLYISQIQGIGDSTSVDKYKDLIQRNFSPTKVGDFFKENILFTQYLIQDEIRINFKLLFFNSNKQLIQFDYIAPKNAYVLELKAIESSIGSIKLIN